MENDELLRSQESLERLNKDLHREIAEMKESLKEAERRVAAAEAMRLESMGPGTPTEVKQGEESKEGHQRLQKANSDLGSPG